MKKKQGRWLIIILFFIVFSGRQIAGIHETNLNVLQTVYANQQGNFTNYLPLVANQHCNSYIIDRFDNPNSGWPSSDSLPSLFGYRNDAYFIDQLETNLITGVTAGHQWDNADHLEVRTKNNGGANGLSGLIFGIPPDFSSYYFLGAWGTEHIWFLIRFDLNANSLTIIDGARTGLVKNGEYNNVLLRKSGSDLVDMFVSGSYAGTHVNSIGYGRIGFFAWTLERIGGYSFDDFTLIPDGCIVTGNQTANPSETTNSFAIPISPLQRQNLINQLLALPTIE